MERIVLAEQAKATGCEAAMSSEIDDATVRENLQGVFALK
jgi:hypothetical protein